MRWLLALWGACSLCLACGGKAVEKPRAGAANACFALPDALRSSALAERAETKLGISLSPAALEPSSSGGFARAQQLVDGVEAALRGGSPPDAAQELLRGFLTRQLLTQQTPDAAQPVPADLDPALAAAMAGELERFVNYWMLGDEGTLASLLTSDTTQLTPQLAEHYGVVYPFDAEWNPVPQTTTERAGLLTLGAFLTRFPSPPARGLQLSQALSCISIPAPPFLESVWDDAARLSTKQIVTEQYGTEAVCANCHRYYVGYAIALDRYDELGRFRDAVGGSTIDTSYYLDLPATYTSASEASTPIEFANPQELGQALSTTPQVRACLAQKLNEYLGGSPLSEAELGCVLSEFDHQQSSFWSLLAALSPHYLGD